MIIKFWTGVNDMNGKMIHLGDILEDYGSLYFVCMDNDHFYLSLVCDLEDSCRNIPYSFNENNQYKVVYSR